MSFAGVLSVSHRWQPCVCLSMSCLVVLLQDQHATVSPHLSDAADAPRPLHGNAWSCIWFMFWIFFHIFNTWWWLTDVKTSTDVGTLVKHTLWRLNLCSALNHKSIEEDVTFSVVFLRFFQFLSVYCCFPVSQTDGWKERTMWLSVDEKYKKDLHCLFFAH